MPKEISYYFCDDKEDDEDFIDGYFGRSFESRAPYWDGTEWSDEDISECPGLDD